MYFRELMEGQKDYLIRRRKQQEMQKKEQREIDEMKRKGIKSIERSVSVLVDHSTPLDSTVATRKTNDAPRRRSYVSQKSLPSPEDPSLEDYLEQNILSTNNLFPLVGSRRASLTSKDTVKTSSVRKKSSKIRSTNPEMLPSVK